MYCLDLIDLAMWVSMGNSVKAMWLNEFDKSKVLWFKILIVPETLFIIFYLLFKWCMHRNLESVAASTDAEFISTGDFSLMVSGLIRGKFIICFYL
jgi:hypothetical protein